MIGENKSKIQYLDKEDYKRIHKLLASWTGDRGEPIPDFSLADNMGIERLVAVPQRTSYGTELYPDIEDKAAIIFYTICKGQIIANGNKRMSTISFLVFLSLNEQRFTVNPDELTNKALWLARTKSEDFLEVKKDLAKWIRENIST